MFEASMKSVHYEPNMNNLTVICNGTRSSVYIGNVTDLHEWQNCPINLLLKFLNLFANF